MNDNSDDALHKTLAKLAHLDLTGCVQYDNTIMKANGGYCDVFSGTVIIVPKNLGSPIVMTVAIKRLRIHIQKDRDFEKLLAKELYIWSKLNHPNVLPLQGFAFEGDYPVVIAQWMENGTLREYLQQNTACNVEDMILGVANGVKYLHQQDVVHSDLKADNVLVSYSGTPLICDFGISRMLSSTATFAGATSGGFKGSMRWMSYELLDLSGDGHHTKESDVWAFGMTAYEILSKELPYALLRNDGLVMRAITAGKLPSRPPESIDWPPFLHTVWETCEKCWISPPEDRITMEQVVHTLSSRNLAMFPGGNVPDVTSMLNNARDDAGPSQLPPDWPRANSDPYSYDAHGEHKDHPFFTQHPWWSLSSIPHANETDLNERVPNLDDYDTISKLTSASKHIHPLLVDSQYTRLDFSSRPFSPRTVPKGSWISRVYVPIYQGYLSQPATFPYATEIKITCLAFGQLAEAWAIKIKPGRVVSVGDVLRMVHDQLQTQMTHAEWARLSDHEARVASQAFTRRCRESELERMQEVLVWWAEKRSG